MQQLRDCPAPAKLNLFLHVLGRRASDGYHELQTIFDLIDLQDTLHFSARNDGVIELHGGIDGQPPDTDLTVRAARLLAQESNCGLGVEIELIKRIPVGGGLGGGSSDAATTLLALNQLWGLNWPAADLAALGLQLGADVPVFIYGGTALATGVGEQLEPISLPEQHFVLIAPPVSVPTAEIFGAAQLTRDSKPLKIPPLSRGRIGTDGKNDLEPVACDRYPQVGKALTALTSVGKGLIELKSSSFDPWPSARMSGSGSCVFLPVPDLETATTLQDRVAAMRVGNVYTVRSMTYHPLRKWAIESQ